MVVGCAAAEPATAKAGMLKLVAMYYMRTHKHAAAHARHHELAVPAPPRHRPGRPRAARAPSPPPELRHLADLRRLRPGLHRSPQSFIVLEWIGTGKGKRRKKGGEEREAWVPSVI